MSMALYVLPYLALSPIYRLTLPTVQGKRVGVLDFERILDIPPRWTFRYCYLLAHSQLSASPEQWKAIQDRQISFLRRVQSYHL